MTADLWALVALAAIGGLLLFLWWDSRQNPTIW